MASDQVRVVFIGIGVGVGVLVFITQVTDKNSKDNL